MLAEVSLSLFFFFLFFFSLLSRAFKKACFEQMLISMLRTLFFVGKWFKKPSKNLSKIFFEKKKLNCGSKNMAPFCAYMGKNISWVGIAKCAIPNSDFLPIFTTERSEPHLSGVCKFWSYRHCKSLFLLIKKQKV